MHVDHDNNQLMLHWYPINKLKEQYLVLDIFINT